MTEHVAEIAFNFFMGIQTQRIPHINSQNDFTIEILFLKRALKDPNWC